MKVLAFIFLFVSVINIQSQEIRTNFQKELASTITVSDLKNHVAILASDNFEGREAGTRGNDMAAQYIADSFKRMGIKAYDSENGYFQAIRFIQPSKPQASMSIGDSLYVEGQDFYSLSTFSLDSFSSFSSEIVFLGYGIKDGRYSDYRRIKSSSLRGKTILILDGEPKDKNGVYRISKTDIPSSWSLSIKGKLETASNYGVKSVLIHHIDGPNDEGFSRPDQEGLIMKSVDDDSDSYPQHYFINKNIFNHVSRNKSKKINKRINKINKKGKSKSYSFKSKLNHSYKNNYKQYISKNVVGFIEGSDPAKKNQIVAITAHYDHLGIRGDKIYNGADDNASGTSAILEIAEAMMEAKKQGQGPRRSIACILMTAEEKGLLGSKFYADNPIFPLDNTVVDINVDMIGRVAEAHQDNPNYIYVIGADRISSELHDINEKMNESYTQLNLDYTFNADDDPNRYYFRSDHYNFAKNGVPSIFYFNGTHADYHKSTDTIEKINFEKMKKINHLIFHTAWEIANRENRLIKDKLN